MKYKIKALVPYFLTCFCLLFLASCKTSKEMPNYAGSAPKENTQDMPHIGAHRNPLKGLSTFTFIALSRTSYDVIKTQLQKYGTVNTVKFLEETKDGIQFNDVSQDPIVTFNIKEVVSIDGKTLPFLRASLNVDSKILVEKTKEECSSYVWTKNCFLPENGQEKLNDKLTIEGFNFLLELFMKDYSAVNSTPPTFDLVSGS